MLNLDILQVVLAFLPIKDLLSASCTGWVVRGLAIQELLSRPVTLHTPEYLQTWCQFVLAEDQRVAHIRDMSLRFENIRPINKRQERLLLTVLQRALLLRRLYISYAETVLNSDSEIPLAISRLPALVSFEVKPFYADTHGIITDILANMSSRLKFLSLHDDVVSPDLEWHYDLPRALSPHLENLQELHLASPNGRGRVIRSSTIHTLRTSLDVEQPRPNELFNDFPNLRNLLISADWLRDDPFKAISQDEYPTLRSSRMSQQTSGNVWDSLDTVRGKVPELYVLGLTCPVRKLEMTKYRPDRRHMALEVLRHTYPRKLTIGMQPMAEESVTSLDEPSLLAALSSNRHQVTHLTIKMTLKEHGPKTQEILVRHSCVSATESTLIPSHRMTCSRF